MKYLMVGGSWDDNGGKSSGYIKKLFEAMQIMNNNGSILNGGYYNNLVKNMELIEFWAPYDVVFWFANVPNDKPKVVGHIKKVCPHIILITSKRNNDEYNYLELISRALKNKSNLLVCFNSKSLNVKASILDPLGNMFLHESINIDEVAAVLYKRVLELTKFTRVPSTSLSEDPVSVPDQPEFFEIARNYGQVFHDLIHAHDTTRFLGNVSFRCESGFPSFKEGDFCYVSKRNVDKRDINKNGFVAVTKYFNSVGYYGTDKPSVDTPIQLKLYEYYKDVKYMLHSHVYIWEAPFTKAVIPCGAIEEIYEIFYQFPCRESSNFSINLKGHGSIVLAKDLDYMKNIQYTGRDIPEPN